MAKEDHAIELDEETTNKLLETGALTMTDDGKIIMTPEFEQFIMDNYTLPVKP